VSAASFTTTTLLVCLILECTAVAAFLRLDML
jgi:hypothetical protein